jgi:hypothetical protein
MASFGIIIGHQTRNWEWKFYTSKVTSTQTSFFTNFGSKLSFILSFLFFWASPLLLHIFSPARTCPTTIISLEPCALKAEFQHFISYLNLIKFPYFADTTEREKDRGWKPAQRQGEDRVTLEITLLALVGLCPHRDRDRDYCIESNF